MKLPPGWDEAGAAGCIREALRGVRGESFAGCGVLLRF